MDTSVKQTRPHDGTAVSPFASTQRIRVILKRAITAIEEGNYHDAIHELNQAYPLARTQDHNEYGHFITAYLGISYLAIGEHAIALELLDATNIKPSTKGNKTFTKRVSNLIEIINLQVEIEDLDNKMASLRSKLQADIQTLQAEQEHATEMIIVDLINPFFSNADPDGVKTRENFEITSRGPQNISARLLGNFEAYLSDGTRIKNCPHKKSQELFKLLLADQSIRHHKEKLLTMLWGDEDVNKARCKLHTAVSRLRRHLQQIGLGDDILLFENETYFINDRVPIQTDLVKFEALIRAGQHLEAVGEIELAIKEYEKALMLYRDDFLAELVDADWLFSKRIYIEQVLLETLTRLAECHYDCGRYSEATIYCRRILKHDNLREDIYRWLMCSLNQQGLRCQALKAYQQLRQVLNQELGVEPMQKTTELADCIREERSVHTN